MWWLGCVLGEWLALVGGIKNTNVIFAVSRSRYRMVTGQILNSDTSWALVQNYCHKSSPLAGAEGASVECRWRYTHCTLDLTVKLKITWCHMVPPGAPVGTMWAPRGATGYTESVTAQATPKNIKLGPSRYSLSPTNPLG